jgi:butyryl-CoA dehydrogenase
MKSFQNKVAVITGAGSGIGRALAKQLSSEGANLALSDVNMAGLEETKQQLPGSGKVTITSLDVSDRAAFEQYAADTLKEFGQVDMVFNNAGVAHAESVKDASYEDFEWIMNINFWGVVHGTKSFLPHLESRPEAALVNISSIFGIIALPTQATYNATKFAVRGFTEALRQELKGSNVYVGCVHPGGIKTNIAANGKLLKSMTGDKSKEQQVKEFAKVARTTPEKAAQTILNGVRKNKRRILIGQDAKFIDRVQRLFPEKYTDIFGALLKIAG